MTSKLLGGSICRELPLRLLKVLTSSAVTCEVGETFEADPLFKLAAAAPAADRGLSKRMLFVSIRDELPPIVIFESSATDEEEDSRETWYMRITLEVLY